MGMTTIGLLNKRSFLPLFLTQFFGAFNDNALKFSMLTLISYHLSTSQTQSERYQAIASALFIIPFFLLSATAGQLADKYNKAFLTQIIKLFEVLLVAVGGLSFYLGHPWLMMVTLTGMGIHSTFFGPIKYAILPDHLPKQQLLGATGLIEASTFLSILLGTILGILSVRGVKTGFGYAIALTGFAAVAGLIASFFILPAKAVATDLCVDWNVWRATKQMIKVVVFNPRIMPVIFAISWFWLIGAVMLTKLPDFTNYVLHADATVLAVFLMILSLGIGLGSIVINYILAGRITLKYVPHAMFFQSLFFADLYWASPVSVGVDGFSLQSMALFFCQLAHWRIAMDLFFLAFSSGLFVVPLYTYLQVVGDNSERSRTIAANNIINALFMVLGTALVMLLLHFHIEISSVFLIFAILNVCAAVFFCIRSRITFLVDTPFSPTQGARGLE
jgi:MFS family permease